MATILTTKEVNLYTTYEYHTVSNYYPAMVRDSHEALRADNAALRARVAELTAEFEAEDAAHEDEIAGHQETILLWTNAKERIADLEKENAELRAKIDVLQDDDE